ncbi:MAG: GTP-binding protein [Candidatus Lokiarchaeota archaeon]|nr:GTP-binding protein [Candidatus Lokiarchaeota archaeon]
MEAKYIIKICLLGEANVGKTSLVYRFIENKFRESYKSTLGVNLLKKDMEIEGYGDVSAQIWDLGGQESFRSLRSLYLEGANGAFVVYDMTSKKTFEKIDEWVHDFRDAREDAPIILIGNKSDLEKQIKITESESREYANTNNLGMVITSAKTGQNVEEAFTELTKKILDQISNNS